MKTILALLIFVLGTLGYGFYLSRDFWQTPFESKPTYAVIPSGVILAGIVVYLTLLFYRARQPRFEVGNLIADDSPGSHSFHIEVTNRGPGRHKPTVTITRLRDDTGKHLPGVRESYQPTEAHWRGCTGPDYHPELGVGDTAYAGVLDVEELNTETPFLCTYPNELCASRRLWGEPKLLHRQSGLQLRIKIAYRSSKDVRITEQNYYVWPDPDAPLKYRVERVRKF